MKNVKITIFVVILMVLSTFTIGIAAEEVFMEKTNVKENNNNAQPALFDAEITFIILTGEGCACDPIEGITVIASGGEGTDQGVTDENGTVVLTLVVLGEYEVFIIKEGYLDINFEFNVLDDQTFTFHLLKKDVSSPQTISIFQSIISRLITGLF